jgi:hypothetical protein
MTEQQKKPKISVAQAVFFGIGIVCGLMLMRFVFKMDGAIGGAIGGAFGAIIGMLLFAVYSKIKG